MTLPEPCATSIPRSSTPRPPSRRCGASCTACPGVDQVGAEARVADLGTRSIKKAAKLLRPRPRRSRMTDLTTLEGADTPGKVRAMCAKGLRPDPATLPCPPCAAVCVYPDMVPRGPPGVCAVRA